MRLTKELPEVAAKLESGALTLSNVASAQIFFKRDEKLKRDRVSESGNGAEQNVEFLCLCQKRELLNKIENTSKRECERLLLSISPEASLPQERERQITQDKTAITFIADAILLKKLDKLKSLLSHKVTNPSYRELFELLADEVLKAKDPELKHIKIGRATANEAKSIHSISTPPKESKVIENPNSAILPIKPSRYIAAYLR